MATKQAETFDRAVELSNFMEYKYVLMLEDIIAEEAEIIAKPEKTNEDLIRLIGLKAMKKHIAEELGLEYHEDEYLEELLDKIEVSLSIDEEVGSET
jgi:hypothetical protein